MPPSNQDSVATPNKAPQNQNVAAPLNQALATQIVPDSLNQVPLNQKVVGPPDKNAMAHKNQALLNQNTAPHKF